MTQITTTNNTAYLSHTVNLIHRQRKLNYKKCEWLHDYQASLWLKNVIELASQIEQQPLLPDLSRQKLDRNTDSSMTYLSELYFDGRKYIMMRNVRTAAAYGHRNRVREEHVSIIFKPDLSCFWNVTQSSASSKATSTEIFECLSARSVNLESVEVIGCDETVVDTKRNGGVIQ